MSVPSSANPYAIQMQFFPPPELATYKTLSSGDKPFPFPLVNYGCEFRFRLTQRGIH